LASGPAALLTKRRLQQALVLAWLALTVAVAAAPYDPMGWDLADATTNYLWTREYARGNFHLPLEAWNASGYPPTQSAVVEYGGDLVIVNEKGPGHALMIVPFYLVGAEVLFGPLLAGLAALSTYVLGDRLFSWRVGWIAAAAVLVNLSVVVMWHRYYWTDASTMPLLAAAAALLVEALRRANGGSLDPRRGAVPSGRDARLALGLSLLGGLAFGGAVSTRYPAAVVLPALLAYLAAFGLLRAWPSLRARDLRAAVASLRPLALLLPFLLGLLLVLVPLLRYNQAYFGGPFRSGYDATSLMGFDRSGSIAPRDQGTEWLGSPAEGLATALRNAVALAPILVVRMPLLLFAPLALWPLRRDLALWLLVPWVLLALYTYLSIGWVVQYARPNLVSWEPRYFMPALPAIALLGGWVVDRVAGAERLHRAWGAPRTPRRSAAFAALLLVPVLLFSVLPSAAYLANPVQAGRGPGPVGTLVTTDGLAANPDLFDGKLVRLDDAVVVQVTPQGARVQSPNASTAVDVNLVDWPAAQRPPLAPGSVVDVQGPFHVGAPGPGGVRPLLLGVKWGTADYLRIVR
jgi:4-amino-4-deoxy-L-arabinose transferase-like glycosyltransferase